MATAEHSHSEDVTRRDFIHVAAGGFAGLGGALALWPFIDQMNPAADALALASIEVDVSQINEGEAAIFKWRGKPVFIRHRTAAEIQEAQSVDIATLPDAQDDSERVVDGKSEWLVVIGVCTHLGCVPVGTKTGAERGEYNGWFCPCHGSHYDTSGRIRKGPAPANLEVPEYAFISDNVIKIG